MKYFKHINGEVYAFELDGSQDHLITNEMEKMTKSDIDRHLYPKNYLTEDEKKAAYLSSLRPLTRRQFMLTLVEFELDDQIKTAISEIADIKQRKKIEIEFNDGQSFERLSESILFMANLLQLDENRVNELWEHGLSL
ncbi:hypothetical protein [Acinetobacter courvalinii]|uniref:Uncharacterized protein n=1 Tax=Acinetobacter courvalinii TaxID=280147 RepID=N9PQE2_9GAMM|nr:hypothetical protein [Acinetobacter courvalinii]ENX35784.1 hypothetical protein F888_03617 [Acinetobacter courvalinii]KAB0655935.1 hypothetical protein F7P77_18240 [Acinetobacter courvalinii]GGH39193.1 hypothetical protein GCM10007354_24830 [Acinetobacter courvalinii]